MKLKLKWKYAEGEFDMETMQAGGGSAVAYAWYVWQKGYVGQTTVRWIN